MKVLVRGLIEHAYVKFNGDPDASKKRRYRATKLESTEERLQVLVDSLADGEASQDEVSEINRLSDQVDELKSFANNALIVSLIHPGEDGNLELVKPMDLGDGAQNGYRPQSDNFFDAGLFKKIVIGEFGVKVAVTDTDEANPFLQFLRRVFSSAFAAVTKTRIDSISNVITAKAADEISKDVSGRIKGSDDDSVIVVGKSKVAKFKVIDNKLELLNPSEQISFQDGLLTFQLQAPRMMRKSGTKKRSVFMPIGASNGKVCIRLESAQID